MTDDDYLREAFAIARRAGANGNSPFGAVLVDAAGAVVLEAENTAATERDCTAHAETNLLRRASRRFTAGELARHTMYTSAEPCCMCSGAAVWSGLGRIVYGLSAARLVALRGESGPPMLDLSCRDVLARSARKMAVSGPVLEDEAAKVFGPA